MLSNGSWEPFFFLPLQCCILMGRTYTIEWFYLHRIADKPQCYKLRIGLRQGKRVFQYLVQLRDELCADALRSYVRVERNDQLSMIVKAIFKEHHLRCAATLKVSCSCTYCHKPKRQSYVMKHFLNDYIAAIWYINLNFNVRHPNQFFSVTAKPYLR